jgi:hypothetical protein
MARQQTDVEGQRQMREAIRRRRDRSKGDPGSPTQVNQIAAASRF